MASWLIELLTCKMETAFHVLLLSPNSHQCMPDWGEQQLGGISGGVHNFDMQRVIMLWGERERESSQNVCCVWDRCSVADADWSALCSSSQARWFVGTLTSVPSMMLPLALFCLALGSLHLLFSLCTDLTSARNLPQLLPAAIAALVLRGWKRWVCK